MNSNIMKASDEEGGTSGTGASATTLQDEHTPSALRPKAKATSR
jgi:hypothetical protein